MKEKNRSLHALIGFLTITLIAGCVSTKSANQTIDYGKAVPLSLLRMPSDTLSTVYTGLRRKDEVIAYYRQQQFKPLWFDSLAHIVLGRSMVTKILNVRYYGLLPQNYHALEIDALLPSVHSIDIERKEALMTDAFLCLAHDLRHGVDTHPSSQIDSGAIGLLREMRHASDVTRHLESREPEFSQYRELKYALHGILDSTNVRVREKLLLGESESNSPTCKIVQTIEINLDRWRRDNDFIEGDRYLFINIPSFMLRVVQGGRTVLKSKVIVGALKTRTPTITSKVECIVTFPYWNVPRRISIEEYLPILQRGDTTFITRNNFDVLDRTGRIIDPDSVNWKKFNRNYFPVSLRQREGMENSLGVIKFAFDNPYAVYVHDTNAKGLFKNEVRTYSHGCVRMENAVELAHYLLTGSTASRSTTLDKYLAQRKRHFLNLSNPVPIYIRYFTCEVVDGTFLQYDDCYGLDREAAACLYLPQ
jgi:murein L,D-transpeptidase YcbB/YkuD